MEELIKRIEDGRVRIGILGLGYVGLPLAMVMAKRFHVVGYRRNKSQVDLLLKGVSYIKDVKDEVLKRYLGKTFFPTTNYKELEACDFLIICVPTPLNGKKEPDLSFIEDSCRTILKVLRRGHVVILESTTYPGTTEELIVPMLEQSGLKAGVDFGVAFSPERVDPGNTKYTTENTPKVVGGINEEIADIVVKLYESVISAEIFKVKSCKIAEASKILENVFRGANIALINEMALIFEKMGIDTWEVIRAASTKPFGFMPHYPGTGVGGHCIPLDPFYLTYKAKRFGFIPRFIELSGLMNEFMPIHTINLAEEGLKEVDKKISNSTFVVMGLAYKEDIDDTRESPSEKIIEELVNLQGKVKVYDPLARSIKTRRGEFHSEKSLEEAIKDTDCAIFVVSHTEFRNLDLRRFKQNGVKVIVDGRNIFEKEDVTSLGMVYKGIGKP
ncbi:MAG: nucleotide sugar dehydrogenase [bacterium]|nr:nucleotide sugar dehydrogenase [bacterium]